MRIKIRNSKDFYAGLVFTFFGILALFEAKNYPMGTARRMGPACFPIILGSILTLLGLVITSRGLWWSGESVKIRSLRPLLLVCSAVLAFAFLIRPVGLVLAILALVFLSCLGGWEFRLRDVIALFLVLATMAVSLFVYGLGLPFNLFWSK